MFQNTNHIIDTFISNVEGKKTDYLKRENSNFIFSLALMRKNIINHAEEKYLMEHIFPQELVDLYRNGVVYIHDKQLSPYCLSVSCKDIALTGIPTLAKNMIPSKPTKRFKKVLRHFSNVVVLMSQQASGAVMLSQMTTILASYLWYEEVMRGNTITEDEIKEEIQSLIWELNMPLRAGNESAFSNITLEFGKPSEEIKDDMIIIGGDIMDVPYKNLPRSYFDRINKAIIEVMYQGTGDLGIPFTFPLITVQIDDDFHYDDPLFLLLLEKMYGFGGIYLENFRSTPFDNEYYRSLNPLIKSKDPSVSRSMCCRLNIDLAMLSKLGSGIFGSSVGNVGAVQVLNLNMNRMLIEYGYNIHLLKRQIAHVLEIMETGHMAKREWIENHKELYPTLFAYNRDLSNFFNVFAITGMHEGLINLGYVDGMKNEDGKAFAHDLMQYISEIIATFIDRDHVACGLEYAPAENAGIKLARHDVEWAADRGRDIFVQGINDDVYITAGCMLPFGDDDYMAQIENAAEFQGYATSGSILHHFIESEISPTDLADYVERVFRKPINYMTLSPTVTSCLACGQKIVAQDGMHIEKCPNCGSDDIATFARVIGYVKMIARQRIHVEENGMYNGDYNFWSNARRWDWAQRHRFLQEDRDNIVKFID